MAAFSQSVDRLKLQSSESIINAATDNTERDTNESQSSIITSHVDMHETQHRTSAMNISTTTVHTQEQNVTIHEINPKPSKPTGRRRAQTDVKALTLGGKGPIARAGLSLRQRLFATAQTRTRIAQEKHLECCSRIIAAAERYFAQRGYRDEGLYRVPGDIKVAESFVAQCMRCISKQDLFLFPTSASPFAVCSTVKKALRLLPDPLLTFELYEQFNEIAQVSDRIVQMHYLRVLISQLPVGHKVVLGQLLVHLSHVELASQDNKMAASNLAVCIALTVLRPKYETYDTLRGLANAFSVIELMLREHRGLFEEQLNSPQRLSSSRVLSSQTRAARAQSVQDHITNETIAIGHERKRTEGQHSADTHEGYAWPPHDSSTMYARQMTHEMSHMRRSDTPVVIDLTIVIARALAWMQQNCSGNQQVYEINSSIKTALGQSISNENSDDASGHAHGLYRAVVCGYLPDFRKFTCAQYPIVSELLLRLFKGFSAPLLPTKLQLELRHVMMDALRSIGALEYYESTVMPSDDGIGNINNAEEHKDGVEDLYAAYDNTQLSYYDQFQALFRELGTGKYNTTLHTLREILHSRLSPPSIQLLGAVIHHLNAICGSKWTQTEHFDMSMQAIRLWTFVLCHPPWQIPMNIEINLQGTEQVLLELFIAVLVEYSDTIFQNCGMRLLEQCYEHETTSSAISTGTCHPVRSLEPCNDPNVGQNTTNGPPGASNHGARGRPRRLDVQADPTTNDIKFSPTTQARLFRSAHGAHARRGIEPDFPE